MAAANVVELPPGFKFDPEDDVLVARYLLPRVCGQPLPFDGIIIEDDPLSAPPWKLLDRYKRKDDAFFFAAGQARSGKGSRQKRTCVGGGCWEGQKMCVDGEKLRVPGTGMEIAWRKYALNFHADGEKGSTGWVMHEYAVTAPAELASSSLRVYRIRFSGHGKKRKREPQDSGADDAGARAAPRRAMAEATLPTLAEYPSAWQSVRPTAVVVDPEATSSDQGSSGVVDNSSFLENIHEPLFSVDDVILPAMEDSGVAGSADVAAAAGASLSDQGTAVMDLDFELPEDIDGLLQYFIYDDLPVPQDSAEAALPPLEEYPLASQPVCPTLVVADLVGDEDNADLGASAMPAGATWPDQGSSGSCFLDLEFPEDTDGPLFSVYDIILPP